MGLWKYLVASFGSFSAALFLLGPRLHPELGLLRLFVLVCSIAILLRCKSRFVAVSCFGHFAGLMFVFSWIPKALERSTDLSSAKAWGLYVLYGAVAASLRMLIILLAKKFFPSLWITAGAIGLLELMAHETWPWYEPLTSVFSTADSVQVRFLLQHLGYEGASIALFIMAGILGGLPLRKWPLAYLCIAIFEFSLLWASAKQADDSSRSIVVRMHQALRSEERGWGGDVYIEVWPEAACQGACAVSTTAPIAIAGVERVLNLGEFRRNIALAWSPGTGELFGYWEKSLPSPYGEEGLRRSGQGSIVVSARDIRVALPICYEILSRSVYRVDRANLIVSVSSDVYDVSGSASLYMSRAAWLRSLEFGVPTIRVSNASHSVVFSADGRLAGYLGEGSGQKLEVSVDVGAMAEIGSRPNRSVTILLLMALARLMWRRRKEEDKDVDAASLVGGGQHGEQEVKAAQETAGMRSERELSR